MAKLSDWDKQRKEEEKLLAPLIAMWPVGTVCIFNQAFIDQVAPWQKQGMYAHMYAPGTLLKTVRPPWAAIDSTRKLQMDRASVHIAYKTKSGKWSLRHHYMKVNHLIKVASPTQISELPGMIADIISDHEAKPKKKLRLKK